MQSSQNVYEAKCGKSLVREERAEALKRYGIENRTAVCRTARTVVWEGGENPLYPIDIYKSSKGQESRPFIVVLALVSLSLLNL